jgi:hypothetical protein
MKNYTINVADQGLTELPELPNVVQKDFDCSHNKLTSLEGCPSIVGADFFCIGNKCFCH